MLFRGTVLALNAAQDFLEGGQFGPEVPSYIDTWCERYGLEADSPYNYKNGLNFGTEYLNSQGVPLFKFQWNEGKTHCMDANDPYTIYDFLCNFTRDENGVSYYMGVEIKLDK